MGLHITRDQFEQVVDLFVKVKDGVEVEAKIRPPQVFQTVNGLPQYSFHQFQCILGYLDKSPSRFSRKEQPEQLDILPSNHDGMRISILGLPAISTFCASGVLPPDFAALIKTRTQPVAIKEHGVTIQYNIEAPQPTNTTTFQDLLKSSQFRMRLKRRVSYTTKDKTFRIDCTIVKFAKDPVKLMHQVPFNDLAPSYEIEVEYIGPLTGIDKPKAEVVSKAFLQLVAEVQKVLEDTEYLIPVSQALSTLQEYHKLAFNKDIDMDMMSKRPRDMFIGPQPVSLELKHLLDPTEGWESILENFTLTHKADGERTLIFVDSKGFVYLINNRFNIKSTRIITPAFSSSIFDAELVQDTFSTPIQVFIFDAYLVNGQHVTTNILIDEDPSVVTRMKYASDFSEACGTQHSRIKIKPKEFLIAETKEDFKVKAARLIEQQNSGHLPFETDGIIFTPKYNPVGANMRNGTPNLIGTWERVLKWKPPQQNSIDFLVVSRKDYANGGRDVVVSTAEGNFKLFDLYVASKMRKTTAFEFLTSGGSYDEGVNVAKLFQPDTDIQNVDCCMVPIQSDGVSTCLNGEIIETKTIVEMTWDNTNLKWLPMRVRHDKTATYKTTNSIASTANNIYIAMRVWNTIMTPVTPDHLRLKTKVTLDTIPNQDMSKYYDRKTDRSRSALSRLAIFHNLWVKDAHLLKRFGNGKAHTLFDIGCGKGGDINKWIGAKFKKVLGIDLYEDNISNPNDGAYARLMKTRYDKKQHNFVFIQMDASQRITDDYIKAIQDPNNASVAKIIWGLSDTTNRKLLPYKGYATQLFDVVSLQFSLHYFFKNHETLQNICYNINKHLKPGGKFVCTFFDGPSVASLLDGVAFKRVKSGLAEDGSVAWAIRRMFEEDYQRQKMGQTVSVYIQTINQFIDEYLADYDTLVTALSEYNIRPLNDNELAQHGLAHSTGLFSDLYQDLKKEFEKPDVAERDKTWMQSALDMTKAERDLSFMNRWAVFTKSGVQIQQPPPPPPPRQQQAPKIVRLSQDAKQSRKKKT